MKLQNLTEDRALSPVIGVILMVAITVILAAVIGAFALEFGDSTGSSAPQVSFDSDYSNDSGDTTVTLTVQSGDAFNSEEVTFSGDIDDVSGAGVDAEGEDWSEADGVNDDEAVTAGDTVEIGVTGSAFSVDLVWQAEDGSESSIIRTLEGPDA